MNDVIRALAARGGREVIVVPIGFVCDHVEVRYDLDVEARATAESLGVRLVRAETANDHPAFARHAGGGRARPRRRRGLDGAVPAPREIVVVGGGIAGLAAAQRVRERDPACRVVVLEADHRLGGSIATERAQGFLIEHGADSFLTEKPWAMDLVRRLGLDDRV